MTNRMRSLMAIVVVFLTGTGNAAETRPPIATIDMEQAIRRLREWHDVKKHLAAQHDAMMKENGSRQADLVERNNQLAIPPHRSPQEYDRLQIELERAAMERVIWFQYQQEKLQREEAIQIDRLRRKIVRAVGRMAKERGIVTVLQRKEPESFPPLKKTASDAWKEIDDTTVVWRDESIDITIEVSKAMNEAYARDKQQKGKAGDD